MKSYVVFISLVAAFGGLLFGFDSAVISGVLPYLKTHFQLDAAEQGWAVSSVIFGCIAGTQLAGIPAEKLGRKISLIITAVLFVITSIGTALADSFTVFIIFRIIGGVAIGAASALSPMYIAEVAPAAYRGRLVSINQLTIVIGILLAFFSNYLVALYSNDSWRLMLGMQLFPAVLFLFCMLFVPESPRWLLQRNKTDEAKKILFKITGNSELPRVPAQQISFRQQWMELVKTPHRKLMFTGIVLAILQQFTGINVIMYYAPVIFEKVGVKHADALFQTIAIGVINLIFTILAIFIIDKLGRKPLLKIGSISMSVFLILLAGTFFLNRFEGYWVLAFVLGFIASFAISWGPAIWVLISEIYPNRLRSTAVSIATFSLWIGAFMVSYTFPLLLKNFDGGYTFLFYSVINLLAYFFIAARVPETTGKSLEDLETLLSAH
jgi:sugar porter (SP) family MFS transporter